MGKDAYWFHHDSNARSDPKILLLLQKYEWRGYGIYWAIIEFLRDQPDYRYQFKNLKALAYHLHLECDFLMEFLEDCINEFTEGNRGLFCCDPDNDFFWSESLINRMNNHEMAKNIRSEKARDAAYAKWGKEKQNAQAMLEHSSGNAQDMLTDAIRGEEKREDNNKREKKKKDLENSPFLEDAIELTDHFLNLQKESMPLIFERYSKYRDNYINLFELMLRVDKRPKEQIKKINVFVIQKGESWWADTENIQSPAKYRQKDKNGIFYFDRFLSDMNNGVYQGKFSNFNRDGPQSIKTGQQKPAGAR